MTSLTIAEAADDLRWIQMVTRLRATGMPIRDVRRYAALVREGAGNEAERLALLLEHREVVERQLAEVTGHLRAIDHKIGIYESSVAPTRWPRVDFERTPGSSLES